MLAFGHFIELDHLLLGADFREALVLLRIDSTKD